jgi:CBS domain-containing protein
MTTIKQIVDSKDRQLQTISPDATVQAAIQIMSSEKISALPVVEHDQLVGIISERDYVRKVASQDIPAWSVKIHEIMTTDVITVNIDEPLDHCTSIMSAKRIRHLPVMQSGELVSLISITDIVDLIKTVKEIVDSKDRQVQTISPDATVQAAIQIMSSEKISALPVMEHDQLVGIISERDCVRKVASQDIPAWSVKIHEIMTTDVITINIDDPVEHCTSIMSARRIRHLPVMQDGELVSLISITDIVETLQPGDI